MSNAKQLEAFREQLAAQTKREVPKLADWTEAFAFLSLALLPGWETMMGLQFENLVLNNLPEVLRALGLLGRLILSAAPYRCERADRGGGVQVDLLVQTEKTAYLVEVKRKAELGLEVAHEIAQKVARLPVRRGVSVRTALVYDGHLSPALAASDAIDVFVAAQNLLGVASSEVMV